MSGYEPPIIVRGEGCYLEDADGKRYLDVLAGLFAVQIGYSYGDEIGRAAHAQMQELPFYTNWSYAHPRAIELAAEAGRARARRPEPRVLRLGRLGGGRVGLEARPLLPRRPRRAPREGGLTSRSPITAPPSGRSRSPASPPCARRSSRSSPDVSHVRNTNRYRRPPGETEEEFTRLAARRDRGRRSAGEGPETVALVIMEPVQNAGGCVHAARRLLPAASGRSATATGSCSPPTR